MKTQIITLAIMFIGITMFAQNNNDYQYDNLNRLKKVTFPNGTVYDYSYDQLGNRTVKVTTSAAPQLSDLVVQNQTLGQTTLSAGASTNASCRIANIGQGSAGGHFVKFYLSANQTYEQGTDIEIGSLYNSAIAAGSNLQIGTNVSIPQSTTPGTWYVLFYADATNLVNESNENNNIATTAITIVNCNAIQLSTTKTDAKCGNNNGTATVNITGGTQPYTYQWSNGHTSASISNLAANAYLVTVTDYYGCTANTTVTVNAITPPSLTMSSTNATCGVNNGSASVSVSGGTSPFIYSWSSGQTTASINNLGAGNYSVTVTDANSCTINGNVTINTPANLSAVLYPTNPTCGSSNGTISSSISGGTSPYSFLWSNAQTGQTANNLVAGTYSLTVTDANNCQFTTSTVLSPVNSMSLSASSTNTTCSNANGTATVTATNGTAPYTYLWSNGQTAQTAINLAHGTYNVTVTSANNCSAVSYATVGATMPPSVNATATATSCTSNTGTATANVTNGTAPYSYLWSNGQTTQSISGLGIGAYAVTITDNNGCTTTTSTTVQYQSSGSSQLPVALGNDINVCQNDIITLDAGVGFTSYIWSNGANSQTITVSNLNPGNHQYFVTAFACGNFSSDTINITVSPIPTGGNTISGITSVCQGQNAVTYTLPAIPNATTYVWTLPTGVTGASNTNSISVNFGITATSGNITVSGVNSCGIGSPSSLSIAVNAKPTTPTITLNGNVLLSDAPLGNQWYNSSGAISNAINQFFIPTQNGDYYSIVTLNGCSSEASNTINFVITDIETVNNDKFIKVYPNPVSNELIIEIQGNNVKINFEILNAIGQIVYKGVVVDKITVPTSSFAPGFYLIKLENGKTFEFKKIIKE